MKHRRLVQHWASGFSLVILVIMFFWRTALTNLILVGLDVFTYFYPYKAYAVQAMTEGSVPLWNPYLFMGVPFLANIQAATLYPLNLPLCWLSIPKMTTCSILIHVFLAGAFTYLFCRQVLRLGAWGAFVSAVTFALGGFLGAQVEHVNQLSVLTWLPALLWLFHHSFTRRGLLLPSLTGLVIGLQFLGGHVQASYINLVALGSYALYLTAGQARSGMMSGQRAGHVARILMRGMGLFLTVVLLGGGLAAIQLLPTYELSTLSIRSGGLPYRQAVSFSLRPELVVRSLLPSFYDNPFSEYVAYVGILPLLLVGLAIWRRGRRQQAPFFITLSMLGLFLALGAYNPAYFALYRLVPGFGVFRAPARWLCLYAFGVAVLAGLGVEELASLTKMNADGPFLLRSRKRIALASLGLLLLAALTVLSDLPSTMVTVTWAGVAAGGLALLWVGVRRQRRVPYLALVVSLVVLELLVASRYLPYNRGTAPEAFSSMRTAVARLLTDGGVHRFLSFSDGSFDPGDLHEIQQIFADQLSEEAVYDYLVATKQKELVTPNLSLLYGLQSVDGYDGGVLPLAGYVELQRLLLSEDDLSPDGRLQGRITEIPRAQVLNLFNVKYVLTDKVYDTWVDGVFYDLGQRAILGGENATELLLDDLPRFPTTALGVVSYLMNGGELAQGSPVAEIRI